MDFVAIRCPVWEMRARDSEQEIHPDSGEHLDKQISRNAQDPPPGKTG